MHPRKELEHMRSNSLPNVFHASSPMVARKKFMRSSDGLSSVSSPMGIRRSVGGGRLSLKDPQQLQLAASDIFTDRMGMIDLNYQDTQKIVRELLEHGSSMPSLNERMSDDALEDVHAFTDIKQVNVRKSLNDLKSSSLPSLNERMSEEELEDVHAFSNLNKGSTKSLRSSLTEMKSTSLPSLNERMSEEELEDVHAFSNLKRTSLGDVPTPPHMAALEEEEEEEEEEEDEESPQDKLANRLFPSNYNTRSDHLTQMKQNGPVSMPNIYGVRVSMGGSTSGSYNIVVSDDDDEDNDILTDSKGICDLEYQEVKKIVDDVLHHKPHDPKSPITENATSETRTSINNITGLDADEVMVIPEEKEEDVQAEEEAAAAAKEKESAAETKPKKKKGFFSRLKKRSTSLKKVLGNP